ncbi:hypothetical protein OE88DRAFT_1663421 [Heliocybe sulcata]|uniref:Uncharacterized protein n=1 Tax=Heliocybe sulcata TaxID=5364 RepID=A0A5C3MW05_9AGAM|nr:hypothetical protein OE88DRAFT_1663421 [Heliocybe sulcata]
MAPWTNSRQSAAREALILTTMFTVVSPMSRRALADAGVRDSDDSLRFRWKRSVKAATPHCPPKLSATVSGTPTTLLLVVHHVTLSTWCMHEFVDAVWR